MGYVTTRDFSLIVGTSPVTVPLQFPGIAGAPGGVLPAYATYLAITNVAPPSPGLTTSGTATQSTNSGTVTTTSNGTSAATPAGGTIWISRSGPAAVNGAGSYPLLPGQSQVFQAPGNIPTNPLSVVATVAGTPLTIEIG